VTLDAGPVVSLLVGDAVADEIEAALRPADVLRISVVNAAEVLDVIRRVHGVSGDTASEVVGRFLDEAARPIAATREQALRAGDVRARHYHRRDRDVSLADCFVIAIAEPGDTVATSDRAVAHVARAEGLDVLALPNARGQRPG
jgi:uncharacterized protein with PIN domain